MGKNTVLTYKGFMNLALEYYSKGGSTYFNGWNEKYFNLYVKEFGPLTVKDALEIFKDEEFFAGFWA